MSISQDLLDTVTELTEPRIQRQAQNKSYKPIIEYSPNGHKIKRNI